MKTNDGVDILSIYKRHSPMYLTGIFFGCLVCGFWSPSYWIMPIVYLGMIFIEWAFVSGFTKRVLRLGRKNVCSVTAAAHERCHFCNEINVAHCAKCGEYF